MYYLRCGIAWLRDRLPEITATLGVSVIVFILLALLLVSFGRFQHAANIARVVVSAFIAFFGISATVINLFDWKTES